MSPKTEIGMFYLLLETIMPKCNQYQAIYKMYKDIQTTDMQLTQWR
jgi:hypothetical protein